MEVRPKKALGQHFLTDLSIARKIAESLVVDEGCVMPTLEVGPGMGVLSQYLLEREDVDLKMVEIDTESVNYLLTHFSRAIGRLVEADFLRLKLENFFKGEFFLKLFMDEPTETAILTGITYLKILSPFYFIVSAKLVADGILRGAGMMNKFMIATFTDFILRVVLAFLLSKTTPCYIGIWTAWPIGWCTATFLSVYFYSHGPWKDPFRA